MMIDMGFWAIDPHEVGESSHDELEEDEKALMKKLTERRPDDDDDELTLSERMLVALEDTERIRERARILEVDQNISEFQVEPEVE